MSTFSKDRKKMEEEVGREAGQDEGEESSDIDDTSSEGDFSLEDLRQQYENSPYSIEIAIKLLMGYKMANMTAELTELRDRVVEIFALPELIWADWLEDSIKEAKSSEERKGILKLFERALEDFDYLDVAVMYCKYAKKLSDENLIRKNYMKIVYEKMISIFCHEFDKGSKFFHKFRKVELQALASEKEEKPRNESIKQIRNLFQRQLRLPLAAIDLTWDEYSKWEQDQGELAKAQAIYDETYKRVEKILDLEEKFSKVLGSSDVDMLIYYLDTLDIKDFGSEKIQSLYEKGLNEFQYNEQLWTAYLEFIQNNIPVRQQLKYFRRGTRHCPSNGMFVRNYLRCLEMNNAEMDEIEKQFSKCISVVVAPQDQYFVWDFLCQLCARRLRSTQKLVEGRKADLDKNALILARGTFQRAVDNFSQKFFAGETEVYLSLIERDWAYIETHVMQSKEYVERVMEKYIRRNGEALSAWKEYINLMINLGQISQARTLVKRCCEYTKDDIEGAYEFQVEFERKWGTLEDLLNAEKKFKADMKKILEAKQIKEEKKEEREDKKPKRSKEEKSKSDQNQLLKKRRGKPLDKGREDESEESEEEDEEREEEKARHNKKIRKHNDTDNSIFVKNIPLTFTDEDLRAVFFKHKEDIVECRLIKDKKGGSKGYAYIDFADKDAAQRALELNGSIIEGKPIFVAISAPPSKALRDDKTLFLNNLPFKISEKKLRASLPEMEEHISDIRIITDDFGKAKGYGYVELKSVEARENALALYKGKLVIDGRKIDVRPGDSNKNRGPSSNNVVLLKNLSFKSREKDILEFFSEFKIKKVNVVKEGNQPKGFAFVEFETKEEVETALELKEGTLNGRKFLILKSNRDITERKDKMEIEEKKEHRTQRVRIQLDEKSGSRRPDSNKTD